MVCMALFSSIERKYPQNKMNKQNAHQSMGQMSDIYANKGVYFRLHRDPYGIISLYSVYCVSVRLCMLSSILLSHIHVRSIHLSLSLVLSIYLACYGFSFVLFFVSLVWNVIVLRWRSSCQLYLYLNWPTGCHKTELFFVFVFRQRSCSDLLHCKHLTLILRILRLST